MKIFGRGCYKDIQVKPGRSGIWGQVEENVSRFLSDQAIDGVNLKGIND